MLIGLIITILLILLLSLYMRESFVINARRRVTLHYVNWCPHCKNMRGVWDTVSKAQKNRGIIFAEIDEEVTKTPGISAYPTIRMIGTDGRARDYEGPPNVELLDLWVNSPH